MCFGVTTLTASNLKNTRHTAFLDLFTSPQMSVPVVQDGGRALTTSRGIQGAPINKEQTECRAYGKEVYLTTLTGTPCAVTGMEKEIRITVGQMHL